MMFLAMVGDESREAADTGSAVHKAISHGLEEMRAHVQDYPQADLEDAERQFQAYRSDPRNALAEIVLCETPVTCETEGVYFKGTVDQVRRVGNRLQVWDVKTSKKGGVQILHEHTYQLAGYAAAASQLLSQPVEVGGIIRTRTYLTKGCKPELAPDGVFFESTVPMLSRQLLSYAARVALRIRNGEIEPGPGDHCSYCPAQGVGACLPQLEEFNKRRLVA